MYLQKDFPSDPLQQHALLMQHHQRTPHDHMRYRIRKKREIRKMRDEKKRGPESIATANTRQRLRYNPDIRKVALPKKKKRKKLLKQLFAPNAPKRSVHHLLRNKCHKTTPRFFPRRRNESKKTGIPKKKSGGERYEGGIQRKKKVKLQKKKKKS
jgi:hypothetical protein